MSNILRSPSPPYGVSCTIISVVSTGSILDFTDAGEETCHLLVPMPNHIEMDVQERSQQ
ncbi:hypothetical protein A6R68_03698, partial [Neotoma lepida]